MTPAALRSSLISAYINTFESIVNDRHGNPVRVIPSPDGIVTFKNWVISNMKAMKVLDEDGFPLDPVDVISADTFKRQAVPPYGLLYPSLIRLFKLFTYDELVENFGESFALKVRDFK
jgi:hypothetical protein